MADEEQDEVIEEIIDDPAVDEVAPAAAKVPFVYRNVIVEADKRITSDTMSAFEITEAITIRTAQIERYNNCLVPVGKLSDPVDMAKKELMARKCPLVIRRKIGSMYETTAEAIIVTTYIEKWRVSEMNFPRTFGI